MKTWLRRLRGASSLGVLGSLAGAVIGAVWDLVTSLLAGVPVLPELLLFWILLGATVGGAAGLGFSVLLSALGPKGNLRGLPRWKAGVWGGVAGAAASCLGIYTVTGALLPFLKGSLPFIVACSAIGVALGGGVIRLAQTAAQRELSPGGGRQGLIGGGRDGDSE